MFDLCFSARGGPATAADAVHDVSDLEVVEQYAAALQQSFEQLISDEFRWLVWAGETPHGDRGTRDVRLGDLGINFYGAAMSGASVMPYLALSVRSFESTPEAAARRRAATVAHELVHLLQFETTTYRFWPSKGLWGLGDPNWWMHEATAIALEAALCSEDPECYPMLWDWATSPQRSLESDLIGFLAAPFVMFLMQALDRRWPAELYRVTSEQVPSMRGTEIINHVFQTQRPGGLPLAAVSGDDWFASRYCVDAGLLGASETLLDSRIGKVVGSRAMADVFTGSRIAEAAGNLSVDHLGCRYFQFVPPENSARLQISVIPDQPEGWECFRGEFVLVGHDGQRLGQQTLSRIEDRRCLTASVNFPRNEVAFGLLVVANCGFGTGWPRFDQLTFHLSAECE